MQKYSKVQQTNWAQTLDPPGTLGFSKRDQQIRLKVETRKIEKSERNKIKMKLKKWSYLNLEELRHEKYDQLDSSCDYQLQVYENDREWKIFCHFHIARILRDYWRILRSTHIPLHETFHRERRLSESSVESQKRTTKIDIGRQSRNLLGRPTSTWGALVELH